jgi:hypothetical protein
MLVSLVLELDKDHWALLRPEDGASASLTDNLQTVISWFRADNNNNNNNVEFLNSVFKTIRCRKCGIKFPKVQVTVDLEGDDVVWLQQMQQTYSIKDLGKTVRIMLDFIQTEL